jgi:hypothetical protein
MRSYTRTDAKRIGDSLNVDWKKVELEQFRIGIDVELEHGTIDMETNVTDDDSILTAKIALAHLKECPDYYSRLMKMEKEAEDYWENKK